MTKTSTIYCIKEKTWMWSDIRWDIKWDIRYQRTLSYAATGSLNFPSCWILYMRSPPLTYSITKYRRSCKKKVVNNDKVFIQQNNLLFFFPLAFFCQFWSLKQIKRDNTIFLWVVGFTIFLFFFCFLFIKGYPFFECIVLSQNKKVFITQVFNYCL